VAVEEEAVTIRHPLLLWAAFDLYFSFKLEDIQIELLKCVGDIWYVVYSYILYNFIVEMFIDRCPKAKGGKYKLASSLLFGKFWQLFVRILL